MFVSPSSFLLSVFLVALLHSVPSLGSAGVPTNITLTRDNPSLKFSPDWKTANAYGSEIFVADEVGSELQAEQLVNVTAIYFVGLKSSVGSTFAACVDCQPVRSPSRQFQIVNAYDPSSPYGTHSGPVVLFSMTGLDPTVPHSLRVVNLWDPKFGDFSRITFDRLIVTSVANTSASGDASSGAASISMLPPSSSGGSPYAAKPLGTDAVLSVSDAGPSASRSSGGGSASGTPSQDSSASTASAPTPAPTPGTSPDQAAQGHYPNTSRLPMTRIASAGIPSTSTPIPYTSNPSTSTPSPGGSNPNLNASSAGKSAATPTSDPGSSNSGTDDSGGSGDTTATTTAAGTTETVILPSVVGNAGSSVTPSESLGKALLAMMILLLIVFSACLAFGIVMLILRARARNNRLRFETTSYDSSGSGGGGGGGGGRAGHITPFVIGTPSPRQETYRNSYTTTYHPNNQGTRPLSITIPASRYYDSQNISPTALTPMAEVYQGASQSPTRLTSSSNLNPFRDSVVELTTPAWLTRSPKFKSPV